MKKYSILLLFTLSFFISKAQGPNVVMIGDSAFTTMGAAVDVPFTVVEFWNITNLNGTIKWDSTVIAFDSISFIGLPYMTQGTFSTVPGGGTMTWQWQHLTTIGSTLNDLDTVFTMRFTAMGAPGSSTKIRFDNAPQPLYWYNFAAWSGTIDTFPGRVEIQCASSPTAAFSDTSNGLVLSLTNTTSGSGMTWLWSFGDGSTDTSRNPSHTYTSDGTYEVCLIASDVCGSDTTCDSISVSIGTGNTDSFSSALEIYPNPIQKNLHVNWKHRSVAKQELVLWGIEGKSWKLNATVEGVYNLESIPNGLYILQLHHEGNTHIRKVLVQH